MAITNGYATLAEYKLYIAMRGLNGSVGTDANDDTIIETLIEATSRYIDRQTGRRFWKDGTDATRYYSTKDPYIVKTDDISAAPTSVSVDLANNRSYTALETTQYELEPINALLDGLPYRMIRIIASTEQYFPTTPNGVKIVAKFGFPATPTDIKDATLAITQSLYAARSGQSPTSGRISVTAGGIVIRPEDVPTFAQRIIESYRYKT